MKIIQAQKDVAWLGSHNFLVLIGDDGRELGQLHGWRIENDVPTQSGFGGKLGVRYTYKYNMDDTGIDRQVIWEGSAEEGTTLWKIALDCGLEINKMNYDYNLLDTFGGHNSNAAAATLIECMELTPVDLDGWTPGDGEIIIDHATIQHIQESHKKQDPEQPWNPNSAPQTDLYATIIGVNEMMVM